MSPELKGLLLVGAIKVVALFVALMVGVILVVWVERRGSAMLQDRLGPNRVGPLGLLQNVADGLKNFFKEEVMPAGAERILFQLAPLLSFGPAFLMFAVIPFAAPVPGFDVTLPLLGRIVYEGPIPMMVADLPIGFLFIIAFSSLAVYGITLAGWAANSKYAFLGAMRSAAQIVAYEIAMGFALVGVLMAGGSLKLGDIVLAQQGTSVAGWFIWPLFPLFLVYFISGLAETNRAPFDVAEGESEIVAGFHVEYGGIAFGLFFLAEYANMILITALTVVFFLGGWLSPFAGIPALEGTVLAAPGFHWLAAKMVFFMFCFLWVRATFPRYRYDQIMRLGWKVFLPITIAWIFVEGVLVALKVGPWAA